MQQIYLKYNFSNIILMTLFSQQMKFCMTMVKTKPKEGYRNLRTDHLVKMSLALQYFGKIVRLDLHSCFVTLVYNQAWPKSISKKMQVPRYNSRQLLSTSLWIKQAFFNKIEMLLPCINNFKPPLIQINTIQHFLQVNNIIMKKTKKLLKSIRRQK